MSHSEHRTNESIDRLDDQLVQSRAGGARLAAESPHVLYAIAARLAAEAATSGSAADLRQAGRWEALADAVVATG